MFTTTLKLLSELEEGDDEEDPEDAADDPEWEDEEKAQAGTRDQETNNGERLTAYLYVGTRRSSRNRNGAGEPARKRLRRTG